MEEFKENDIILGYCRYCKKLITSKLKLIDTNNNNKRYVMKILRAYCTYCGEPITDPYQITTPLALDNKDGMNNIFLTVTIGYDYRLLSKFLQYYIKQDVSNFLIILNTDNKEVYKTLLRFGISPVHSWLDEFSEEKKIKNERQVIETICNPEDWIIYTDLDEFQYYPDGLTKSIYFAENSNYDYIEGKLVDRVSESGKLIDIDLSKKLEDQFPLGGFITKPLLKAWDKKIVAARKNKIVGGGHHIFLDNEKFNTLPYKGKIDGPYKNILIHHFKWDSFVINRMKSYLSLKDESLNYWKKEMSLFIKHYKKYSRIKIDTKKFNFSKLENILNI
jgi:hypothetical protein